MGIKGIDNKEYAFPTYQEIAKRMKENKEMLKIKTEQGFNQLLIVPFGMKLEDLIEKYKNLLWQHYKDKKLFATMANPKKTPKFPDDLPFDKDTIKKIKSREIRYGDVWEKTGDVHQSKNSALFAWEKYQNADINGELAYFPKEFSKNHQGKTKLEILKEQGGFNILFIEDMPNIPRGPKKDDRGKIIEQGKGKEIKGRKQLEAGQKPNEYLEILKTDPQYQNETGMTPEEQIIYAIKHLEQTNQVIDDWQGKGSLSYQLGAYFPAGGGVPGADWYRDRRRADLDGYDPRASFSGNGARGAVRVPA